MAMTDTVSLLYRYLRLLSVRVDRGTVRRLLAHPLGDSLRGLSDALDTLGVKNAAYQLPAECLDQVEAPFIAVIHREAHPFCLVEQRTKEGFIIFAQGKRMSINREAFLQQWNGGVLISEVTEATRQDRWYAVKNGCDLFVRHNLLVVCLFLLLLSRGIRKAFFGFMTSRCGWVRSLPPPFFIRNGWTTVSCTVSVTSGRRWTAMRCCVLKVPASWA